MTQKSILATVRQTIAHETGVPLDSIGLDTPLETMNIDSLDFLRIAASLEKQFQITISTAELTQIRTVGDIVSGLGNKLTA